MVVDLGRQWLCLEPMLQEVARQTKKTRTLSKAHCWSFLPNTVAVECSREEADISVCGRIPPRMPDHLVVLLFTLPPRRTRLPCIKSFLTIKSSYCRIQIQLGVCVFGPYLKTSCACSPMRGRGFEMSLHLCAYSCRIP